MSNQTKIVVAAAAALTLGATALATTGAAEAHYEHFHYGFGYGGFCNTDDVPSYQSCHYVPRYDRFGASIGSVEVCDDADD
ncbi:MAG TPA: hypothetical protein VG985_03305 [Xanthobacteraceae bacterium]|nr:hypothetical protein [Xanthobacteraceae bacterium]